MKEMKQHTASYWLTQVATLPVPTVHVKRNSPEGREGRGSPRGEANRTTQSDADA
jgi:hypothetical protein